MNSTLEAQPLRVGWMQRLVAEALGTLLLLAAVVGSGIMGDQLAAGNDAVALLANTIATAAILIILIMVFGPLSGAHFNPVVTLVMALRGELPWRELPGYVGAQLIGALAGVMLAHLMFELPLVTLSHNDRSGVAKIISEIVATFGLVAVILACATHRKEAIPYAVAAYIASAYWFTASTSFANPAVTVARTLTDTFSGIRWQDAPAFIVAQIVGALAATLLFGWLLTKPIKNIALAKNEPPL
jgi:glycerol uptake facilitator-like aquaporin